MPYLVGPDIYSRIFCADSEGSAKNAALLAAVTVIPLSFLMAGLGVLIHGQYPGLLPEAALPTALSELAPAGVKGLIVVGVLGAIMSSADTTLISASTILSINLVSPVFGIGQAGQLRLTRLFVVTVGILAWAIATFQEGIIASLLLAYTVFVGGVAVPTLASFWRGRLGITGAGAFWAVVAGGSLALLGGAGDGVLLQTLLGEEAVGLLGTLLGPEYASILPLVVSVVTLFVVSRFSARGEGDMPRNEI
jgi:SSS family solute:Na+ symporter